MKRASAPTSNRSCHCKNVVSFGEQDQIWGMKLFTLSSGTARPMYRIRTKSKTLEAKGRAFKLMKGMSTNGMKRGEQRIRTSSCEPT